MKLSVISYEILQLEFKVGVKHLPYHFVDFVVTLIVF